MELDVGQLGLLGTTAVVLFQVIKIVWVGVFRQPKPTLATLRLLVFALAVPFGIAWAEPVLPAFPDLPVLVGLEPLAIAGAVIAFAGAVVDFLGGLVAAAGAVYAVMRVVYDYLLEEVLEAFDGFLGVGLLSAPRSPPR